jgi:hypothetical protein
MRFSGVRNGLGASSISFWWVALHAALALAEVDQVAVGVAEHLELDVARLGDELLEVHAVVAERRARLGLRDADAGAQLLLVERHAHAAPAAACYRLDDHRVADRLRQRQRLVHAGDHAVAARHHRETGGRHGAPRLGLVAHLADHLGVGADEGEAARRAHLGEVRVLGEEAVAGMDRVGAGDLGRPRSGARCSCTTGTAAAGPMHTDSSVREPHVQAVAVGLGRNRYGRDLDSRQERITRIANLAAVRDQDLGGTSLRLQPGWRAGWPPCRLGRRPARRLRAPTRCPCRSTACHSRSEAPRCP